MSEIVGSEDHPDYGLTEEQRKKLVELTPIYNRVYTDMPSLMRIVDGVLWEEAARHLSNHPIARLCQYLASLQNTCLQASYSIQCVNLYCTAEENAATIANFGFYVEYYIYDLLTRVKTTTDLLALLSRHIFELIDLKDELCSLHHGKVPGVLRKGGTDNKYREELAKKLDRMRHDWVEPFYELRNEIIHRTGLRVIGSPPNSFSSYRFNIMLPITDSLVFGHNPLNRIADLKPLADQGEPLSKFLIKIGSKSLSPIDHGIDVVRFCEEIWGLLTVSVEDIIKTCEPQINTFISAKKTM